jgi:small subunit ribosomal protein S1
MDDLTSDPTPRPAESAGDSAPEAVSPAPEAPRPKKGEVIKGRISVITEHGLDIALGDLTGHVGRAETDRLRADGYPLETGLEVPALVLNPEDKEGRVVLSVTQGFQYLDWVRADQLLASGKVWEGRVSGHNRGGLIVPFGHIKAFVPASHVAELPHHISEADRSVKLKAMVGQTFGFKIIEVDHHLKRLLLSQRNAQKEYRGKQKARLLTDLMVGQRLTGKVTGLREFGAFIDLGGADGLIHVSEISWKRVRHPAEVLSLGQEVAVEIVKIDPNHNRIGLSMKKCQPDPWQGVTERLQVGAVVDGVVTRMTAFGAFVDVSEGAEGLLPTGQIHNQPTLGEGAVVVVKILRIEPERQRVGLSFQRVKTPAPAGAPPARPVDLGEEDSHEA